MKTWPENGVGTVVVFVIIGILTVCPQSPPQCLTHERHTHKTTIERSTNTRRKSIIIKG